jgi:tRNA pseudouridine55 synthase
MHGKKRYEGPMLLGVSTDTFDSEGKVVDQGTIPDDLSLEILREKALFFTGRIKQEPPVFSALKHNGQPLYKLARQGAMIKKPAREVEINLFEIEKFELPEVAFTVECSEGTYIRSLVNDFGNVLGCGACMTSLRRTANGAFDISDAVTLPALEEAVARGTLESMIVKPRDAVRDMLSVTVSQEDAEHLRHGRPVRAEKIMGDIHSPRDDKADALPYIRIETACAGSPHLVAIARRPSEASGKIETLKVWN